MHQTLFVGALALALSACGGTKSTETGDTGSDTTATGTPAGTGTGAGTTSGTATGSTPTGTGGTATGSTPTGTTGTGTTGTGTGTTSLECTDPRVPLEVTVGVGEFDCAFADSATEVVLFNGPQGGWHVDACFTAENVPEAVFFTTKVTLIDDGIQIAGSDEYADRVGVALVDYDETACTGHFEGARGLINDQWVAWPTEEEVCAWEGLMIRIEVELHDFENDRRGSDVIELPAVLEGADGPFDCSDFTG